MKVPGPSGLFDGRPSHLAVGTLEGQTDPTFQAELRRSLAKLPVVTVYDQPVVKTTVTTDLRYRVEDLSTGLLLLEGTLAFVARTTFDILLGRKSTLETQREAVLKDLRKDLTPHREASTFWLCSDADLSALAEGIEAAKADRWPAAAGYFQRAVDAKPGHPRLHKARYDLGLALLALGRLEPAKAEFLQVRSLLQGTSHGLSPRDLPSYVERNEAALTFGLLLERRERWAKGGPL